MNVFLSLDFLIFPSLGFVSRILFSQNNTMIWTLCSPICEISVGSSQTCRGNLGRDRDKKWSKNIPPKISVIKQRNDKEERFSKKSPLISLRSVAGESLQKFPLLVRNCPPGATKDLCCIWYCRLVGLERESAACKMELHCNIHNNKTVKYNNFSCFSPITINWEKIPGGVE